MKIGIQTLAVVAALCVAPGLASAKIIDFSFTTNGGGSVGPGLPGYSLQLDGTLTTDGIDTGTPGTSQWSFSSLWHVDQHGALYGDGTGTWLISDMSGVNEMWGTLTANLLGSKDDHLRSAGVLYSVADGIGLFGHASGAGFSGISFWDFPSSFDEAGKFRVNVPEPGMLTLFAAGLFAVGIALRRRRHARARFAGARSA